MNPKFTQREIENLLTSLVDDNNNIDWEYLISQLNKDSDDLEVLKAYINATAKLVKTAYEQGYSAFKGSRYSDVEVERIIEDARITERNKVLNEMHDENCYSDFEHRAYRRGLDDAWNAVRKIAAGSANGIIVDSELKNCFKNYFKDICDLAELISHISASEAIQALETCAPEETHEVDIGDEIIIGTTKGIVLDIDCYKPLRCSGVLCDGKMFKSKVVYAKDKTGRHFNNSNEFWEALSED